MEDEPLTLHSGLSAEGPRRIRVPRVPTENGVGKRPPPTRERAPRPDGGCGSVPPFRSHAGSVRR